MVILLQQLRFDVVDFHDSSHELVQDIILLRRRASREDEMPHKPEREWTVQISQAQEKSVLTWTI